MDEKLKEEIEHLRAKLSGIQNNDIRHDELGTLNGFHDAEQSKNGSAALVLQTLDRLESHGAAINPVFVNTALAALKTQTTNLESLSGQIEKTVATGVNNQQFPVQRKQHLTTASTLEEQLHSQLASVDMALRIAMLEELIGDDRALTRLRKQAQDTFRAIEKDAAQIGKIVDGAQDKTFEKGVAAAKSGFASLSADHANRERYWFWSFLVCALIGLVAVAYAALGTFPANGTAELVATVFKRLLLISTAGLLMRVTLSKYDLERNLRILYDHRDTVLDQYRIFEASIGDDTKAKNEFRLEIAKHIFAEPRTGYAEDRSSEISINPVTSVVERAVEQSN